MAVTLDQLEARVRDLAELENDDFVDQTQIQARINDGYRKLWNLVRRLTKGKFFETLANVQITSGNTTVTLPSDFGRMIGVWWRVAGASSTADQVEKLPKFELDDIPSPVRAYRVRSGNVLEVSPASLAPAFYAIRYEKKRTLLADSTPGPAVDMDPLLEEWAEYPALYAARSSRGKGDQEYKQLSEDLDELTAEIADLMSDTDVMPDTIIDVYAASRSWMEKLPPP